MRVISYIIVILLIIFGLSFALLNAEAVRLNYYLGSAEVSLALLLILTVGLGVIIGFVVSLGPLFKLKRRNSQLRFRIKQLEQELVTTRGPENKAG